MPKKKRRKKTPPRSKKPRSNIPESASTVRFLIFLAIGFIMLAVFIYFAFKLAGFSSLEEELSREMGRQPSANVEGEAGP